MVFRWPTRDWVLPMKLGRILDFEQARNAPVNVSNQGLDWAWPSTRNWSRCTASWTFQHLGRGHNVCHSPAFDVAEDELELSANQVLQGTVTIPTAPVLMSTTTNSMFVAFKR